MKENLIHIQQLWLITKSCRESEARQAVDTQICSYIINRLVVCDLLKDLCFSEPRNLDLSHLVDESQTSGV